MYFLRRGRLPMQFCDGRKDEKEEIEWRLGVGKLAGLLSPWQPNARYMGIFKASHVPSSQKETCIVTAVLTFVCFLFGLLLDELANGRCEG